MTPYSLEAAKMDKLAKLEAIKQWSIDNPKGLFAFIDELIADENVFYKHAHLDVWFLKVESNPFATEVAKALAENFSLFDMILLFTTVDLNMCLELPMYFRTDKRDYKIKVEVYADESKT